ncbi:MAG: hypothetical protein QM783_15990 [Phycisphaerales bacterium]
MRNTAAPARGVVRASVLVLLILLTAIPSAFGQFQSMAPMVGQYALKAGASLRMPAVCVRPQMRTPLTGDLFRATRNVWLREIDQAGKTVRQLDLADAAKQGWVELRGADSASGMTIAPTPKLPGGNWRIDVDANAVLSSSEKELAAVSKVLDTSGTKTVFRALNEERQRIAAICGNNSAVLDLFDHVAVEAGWRGLEETVPDIAQLRPGKALRRMADASSMDVKELAAAMAIASETRPSDAFYKELAALAGVSEKELRERVAEEARAAVADMSSRLGSVDDAVNARAWRSSAALVCASIPDWQKSLRISANSVLCDHFGVSEEQYLSKSYVRYCGGNTAAVERLLEKPLPEGPSFQGFAIAIEDGEGLRIRFDGKSKRIAGWSEMPLESEWPFKGLVSGVNLTQQDARLLASRNIHAIMSPELTNQLHGKTLRMLAVLPQNTEEAAVLFPGQDVTAVLEEAKKWREIPGVRVESSIEGVKKALSEKRPDEHFVTVVDAGETAGIRKMLDELGESTIECDKLRGNAVDVRTTSRINAGSLREALALDHAATDGADRLRQILDRYADAEKKKGRSKCVISATIGEPWKGEAKGAIILLVWAECCQCDHCTCESCKCDKDECCKHSDTKTPVKEEK